MSKYHNVFVEKDTYYEVFDNNNNMFIIDKEDKERVSMYYWGKYQSNYFKSMVNGKSTWLERFILDAKPGEYVDHKNNQYFDYRKENLRLCNNAENNRNRGLQSNNTSGYSGVDWAKREQQWRARIKVNGKEIHLGYFNKLEDAINAKKQAEEKYFKEFSYKNSQEGSTYVYKSSCA